MSCNSCQQELFQTLGWKLWAPVSDGYAVNSVVINPGNSNLYISLVDDNITIPAQPGAMWAITTVAALIQMLSGVSFTFPTWVSGGGAGAGGSYNVNQAVAFEGGNYISLENGNGDTPGSSNNWQSFAMNNPG